MKIAIYQGASPEGDVEYAIKIVEMTVRSASVAGVKMIVFPELFLPGYNQPELHKSIAQSVCGKWEKKLAQISKKYSCGLTLGWAEQDEDRIFNTVSSFDEHGHKVCHYRKIQLFGQCIRAFKCTVQGTPANLTRNPVLGGFVRQESREGYGYTSINTTRCPYSFEWHYIYHKRTIMIKYQIKLQ